MSAGNDTDIGGRRAAFPETPASAVLGVGSDDPVARGRAFQALVRAYWKPVYKAVRIKWRKNNEEAKDLTQAFFTRALEKGIFASYQPERGRFRTFVRTCVHNFVTNEHEAARALKRGGGAVTLQLDFDEAEGELTSGASLAPDVTFEEQFDREWARHLHAMAVRALRERLTAQGKEIRWRLFELYDLEEDPERRPTYAELADRFGIKTTDVTNWLHGARRDLRRIVLSQLRSITANEDEFRQEAREMLGVDSAELAAP